MRFLQHKFTSKFVALLDQNPVLGIRCRFPSAGQFRILAWSGVQRSFWPRQMKQLEGACGGLVENIRYRAGFGWTRGDEVSRGCAYKCSSNIRWSRQEAQNILYWTALSVR